MSGLDPVELLIRLPIVLLALTVHEFSHAYFALRMGDPTAYRMGRCTLNPIRHLEPLGTLCLLFAPIGWAKPVPVNPLNFHDRRKGELITSSAGPLSNIAQALLFALLFRILIYRVATPQNVDSTFITAASMMLMFGIIINVGLAVFNFLPLYPLDGFHVTLHLLSPQNQQQFADTAMYGPFVILGIVLVGRFTGFNVLMYLIGPPVNFILEYVAGAGPIL